MPRLHVKWYIPVALLLVGCVVAFLLLTRDPAEEEIENVLLKDDPPVADTSGPAQPGREVIEDRIAQGETAAQLFDGYLSPGEINQLAEQCRMVFPLSRLGAGQKYRLSIHENGFERFEYDIDADEQLIICRNEDGFGVTREPIPYQVSREVVRGTVDNNLFDAMAAVGEQPELAKALGDIFAWDIDFIRDLRRGDTFQILVEKRFRDGKPAGYGKVLAAEFVNQGTTYQAFRFEHDGAASYYDAKGNNLHKAFLMAPLSFCRISSGFTMRRFHPILKTWRAHPAIDYAAPPGTPIKTVADGIITKIGYTRYNGNFIKIRHRGGYESLYLHMRGFAQGMQDGKKLVQGQVIGYVGSTGLATGPHL
ncbi:MAG: peptidoglycan DD-metalloendopeptidase family protein [Desulfobacteraceae bacterium]|nr:peptidoglycan DD-metalloendopeptidase family protein [Desulfobacteraceae bacterium]